MNTGISLFGLLVYIRAWIYMCTAIHFIQNSTEITHKIYGRQIYTRKGYQRNICTHILSISRDRGVRVKALREAPTIHLNNN